jgi:hypothetical protein
VSTAIEELMGTTKKPGTHRAEMICSCGELDKEEARGWLVADAVGRPLCSIATTTARRTTRATERATSASACSSSVRRRQEMSRR